MRQSFLRIASVSIAVLFISLSATGDAGAQPAGSAKTGPKGSAFGGKKKGGKQDPKIQEAKRLFDEGSELYAQGNYEKAIELWEKSYDLSKAPLIFDNIAHAYERFGKPKQAYEYLSKWREAAPESEHETLDARLKNLEERIRKDEQAEKERLEKEKLAREEAERKRREDAKPPVFPIVLAAAGGALVVGGVVVDIIAASKRPDKDQACRAAGERLVCAASEQNAIKSSNTLAYIGDGLWIGGGIAAAVGLVLFLTHKTPATAEEKTSSSKSLKITNAKIEPLIGQSSGGLWISGQF